MRGTILQPTYLPWIGYFEMINSSDVFIVFDHVQFERKSWQQRNKIKTANGIAYLTVPVQKAHRETKISEIKISYEGYNPFEKHWKTIELSYKKAPYFEKYKPYFEKIYSKKYVLLRDLNVDIIKLISDILGVKKKIINLCKKAGIDHLYDAKGAEDFLGRALFQKEGISIDFQKFLHPEYPQLWGKFAPYLSAIDLIFNQGDKSLDIIKSGIKNNK